jgi:GT2 family glycosyltransferase
MRVAAVVVNWNGGQENIDCLRSLADQTEELEAVFFVDNGSVDGSAELVEARFPLVRVIRSGENLGYGGGNNRGIAAARELGVDAVLVINNDVVLERNTIALLAAALQELPAAGVVGPRVLYKQERSRLWAAGGELTYRQNLTTLLGHGQADGPRHQVNRAVAYVPGCTMLVRTEVFDRSGLFDERYFMYTEDVDFCVRAAKAGFRSYCVGAAAAYHAASFSTGGGYNPKRKYMMGVNSIWFLRRYAGPLQWVRFVVFDVLTLPLLWLAALPQGRAASVAAKARGICDGLRGRRVTAESAHERP